jgi:radical SAM protein with 4Fe4S-binding SPASM domain
MNTQRNGGARTPDIEERSGLAGCGRGWSTRLLPPYTFMLTQATHEARGRLAATEEQMRHIAELTAPFHGPGLDVVHIRFPNSSGKPLAGCRAGAIIYVFTRGEMTICPYLVFAARTPQSQHDPREFIVGNIFTDADIAARLDAYRFSEQHQMGANVICGSCGLASTCGKGCPAAVVAAGQRIGAVDTDMCPVTSSDRRLLPVVPA